jgi:putative sporulation protein YyaC
VGAGRGGWRKTVGGGRLEELFERIKSEGGTRESLLFLCIGTDRSSGDAFGPLTGTLLSEAGFTRVIGTLERPCDADTWNSRMAELEACRRNGNCVVVALDACLGTAFITGMFVISDGPLEAGRSMKRGFVPVGDYSIAAVVNENRANPYSVLQNTPLSRVLSMSRQVVAAALQVFGPDGAGEAIR